MTMRSPAHELRLPVLIAALLLAFVGSAAAAQTTAPQVRVASGAVAGVRDGPVVSFKGIPYAASPVGELRWRAPRPVKAWSGVRAAEKYGALCQQKYNGGDNGVGPLPASEDCLTLNVFAPAGAKAAPVMFWIHGGGFVNGSGTAALYDGSALAKQGVVVVTINYRLGRFGFFAHPALSAEARGEPLGNYALMDMIAALQWVKANIGKFGGDPRNVTIFGESAGGAAVNELMISPAARGLFSRAICESGLGRETAPPLAEAEKAGLAFAAKVGAPTASAADLRKLTPEQILAAGDPDMRAGGGAIADGKILTMSPMEGFTKGIEAKVPYVVGSNSLEFPAPASMVYAALAAVPQLVGDGRPRLEAAYPDKAAFETHVFSDMIFVEPALSLARLHASHGQPTWAYRFSVLSKSAPSQFKGAPHASERQYVFQTLKTSPWPTDVNDAAQAATMSAYWVDFAKSADPNGGGRPRWPAYEPGTDLVLDFTNAGPIAIKTPRRSAMDALSGLYRK
jgi:para-nitrobenzyl esterase